MSILVSADMKIEKVYKPLSELRDMDFSKAFVTIGRLQYPKIAKKSKLDDLLARRTHLKAVEERRAEALKVR